LPASSEDRDEKAAVAYCAEAVQKGEHMAMTGNVIEDFLDEKEATDG
jgi:hypothetical protein